MTKALQISYVNRADVATLTGGAWASTLPLANLQTAILAKVARTTNALAASTQFQADLGASPPLCRLLALVSHNLSVNATYQLKVGTTPGAADIYDSGSVSAWPAIYLPGDLEWELDNWWTGVPSSNDVLGYPMAIWHDIGFTIAARYWTLLITDTANPAGYIQAGRLWIGGLWAPQHSVEYGASLMWEPRDVPEISLGGVAYFDLRPNARIYTFSLGALTAQESYGVALEIQRIAKNSQQVIIIPDADDTQYAFKRNLLARMRKMDPLKQITHSIYGVGFEAEEVL